MLISRPGNRLDALDTELDKWSFSKTDPHSLPFYSFQITVRVLRCYTRTGQVHPSKATSMG